MKLAEQADTYYPDISNIITTVEELSISLIRWLLFSQKQKSENSPNQTQVITQLDVDEVARTIIIEIDNIYGNHSHSFQVANFWEVADFKAGLKDWPFNGTNLHQAVVNLIMFLSDKQTGEESFYTYALENESGGATKFSARIEVKLKYTLPLPLWGANTANEVIEIGQTI